MTGVDGGRVIDYVWSIGGMLSSGYIGWRLAHRHIARKFRRAFEKSAPHILDMGVPGGPIIRYAPDENGNWRRVNVEETR